MKNEKQKELGIILDRLHKSNLDSDLIQDTGIKVLSDLGTKDITNLYGYVRKTYQFLSLDSNKKHVREKEVMQSNIRNVNGIEIDITESVPAPPPRDTEKKLKLINAIVQAHIHSNKLLKVFDLKFIQLKTQKEMTEELDINRTTLAMQESRLIELLKGIDNLRDILASPTYPINNVPSKGSAPSIKTLTVKLSGPVNILDKFDRPKAMREREQRKELKPYKHQGNVPTEPYRELTAEQLKAKSRVSKAILTYNQIKGLSLTAREQALELAKQGIDKLDIKGIPYKLWDLKSMVAQASCEELHLIDKEYTAWSERHPAA